MQNNIIFFDGVCNLCNGFVSTMVSLDKKKVLRYAPPHSKAAEEMNISDRTNQVDSIIFLRNDKLSVKSDAVLEIFATVYPSIGFLFRFFQVIPGFIRNWLYNLVARNRYRIFGKSDTCRLPSPEERELFLD